jgi:ATP-dependent protease ClpP protease subunit
VYTTHNHIYFKTDVTDESIDKLGREIDALVFKIKQLEKKSLYGQFTPNPIYLHITTNGGSLLAGFLAYDKIRGSAIPINTIIEGSVASAGSIMSIAGSKRYMTANSHLLIHQLRNFIAGTFETLVDDHKNCRSFMKRMVNMYHLHSNGKMSKKRIKEYLKHDIFWSFEESLQNGLVDDIWPKPSSD